MRLATDAVKVAGATGAVQPTVRVKSLDGALVPAALVARTRTKYCPVGTLGTTSGGAVVGSTAMFEAPCDDPASSRYPVGEPPLADGVHDSVTVLPFTVAPRPVGTPGGVAAPGSIR